MIIIFGKWKSKGQFVPLGVDLILNMRLGSRELQEQWFALIAGGGRVYFN